jgi:hypothetical protein
MVPSPGLMHLELTDEETAALLRELDGLLAGADRVAAGAVNLTEGQRWLAQTG